MLLECFRPNENDMSITHVGCASFVSYKLITIILRQLLYLEIGNMLTCQLKTQLVYLKSLRLSRRNCIFLSDSFLMAGFFCILYSYVVIRTYVSMSTLDSLVARTDYLSGYQKRKKKQKQVEQEKKEQAKTRCLDNFS